MSAPVHAARGTLGPFGPIGPPGAFGAPVGQHAPGRPTVERVGRLLALVIAATWAAGLVLGFQRSLTVLVALGFVGAVAGVRHPALGLLSVALLCALDAPARVFLLVGGLLRYNTFNYWLVVVAVLGIGVLQRLRDPQSRLLQLFVILLGIELLPTQNLVFGLQHYVNVVAAFGLLVYFVPAASGRLVWLWMGICTGLASAGGGLLYYLQRDALPGINPNAFSLFPMTGLFAICLAMPFTRELGRGQLPLILLSVVNWGWVFLSGSRGGLLMATVCIAYLIVVVRGVGGRLTFALIALVVGLAISTQFTDMQTHTLRRLDRLFNSKVSLVSRTSGRSELMRGGWEIFREHPMGVGTGGFATAWSTLSPSLHLAFRSGQEFQSHSAWLKVLAENGIPGILLFGGFVGSFLVVGVLSRAQWALGAMVTFVLAAAFGTTEFQAKGLWFLAAGAITLLHRRAIAGLLPERAP